MAGKLHQLQTDVMPVISFCCMKQRTGITFPLFLIKLQSQSSHPKRKLDGVLDKLLACGSWVT